MLNEIRELQVEINMSDAELLKFARAVAGCARIRCLEDLMAVEVFELLEEMRGMVAIPVMLA